MTAFLVVTIVALSPLALGHLGLLLAAMAEPHHRKDSGMAGIAVVHLLPVVAAIIACALALESR